jgi:tRNA-splicing ligase RtcB
MFVIANENTRLPIKVWLAKEGNIEESCLEQAMHLSNLPFIDKWVALMPDIHAGMGMPIGAIIATKDVIIPNAVGVDIGCGMAFVSTNIKVSDIKDIDTGNGLLINAIIGDLLRNIPVGFSHHKEKQPCTTIDNAFNEIEKYQNNPELVTELESGYYQVGTLGGGNHFIELQEDSDGYLAIMLHSGSRHFGKKICDYFHNKARILNQQWYSSVPDEYRLAFLPITSEEGQQYIYWMNLALDFAYENRQAMLTTCKTIVEKWINKYADLTITYTQEINCHHNYASLEHHFGKNVWVHRKGAIRARKGDLGIIPGAMGSYSYIVEGLGNEMSFQSSSHGAGRQLPRKKALQSFSVEEVMIDLKQQGVVLGKHSKKDVAEESRFAYKDIETVMLNQEDLVTPIKQLKTIGVVKG